MLAAWRGIGSEGHSALGTWPYPISMRVCLRLIFQRPQPLTSPDYAPALTSTADLGQAVDGPVWIEPLQRGSVLDMMQYPGDPLTPGVGATEGAARLTRESAPVILKIPVLPISYGDATQLLSRLGGALAPLKWRGGLPLAYHIGGDDKLRVHLAVRSDWSMKTLYNVIATLEGARYPDQWIVRGNHHDAWVFGAQDPLSGNVAMLSEAKALGGLVRAGWRPARTIVYTSWDGEEPGLLGSTEWAETHAAELKAKALLYINTDNNDRGFLFASGSHDYQRLVNAVAADVTDPETGKSLLERRRAAVRAFAFDGRDVSGAVLAAAEKGGDMPIGALGSGSDYTPFLQHLGIAALNLGFYSDDASGGEYHSVYDSFHHFTTFNDPGLVYGAVLAKVVGRLVLRVADADTPPQRFDQFADQVVVYLDELKKLVERRRAEDDRRSKLTASGAFRMTNNPARPVGPPPAQPPTPFLNFAPLDNAVAALKARADDYTSAFNGRAATLTPAARDRLNGLLAGIDQLLLDDRGLPGRPWFRNLIYAPGRLTGYGAKTLPGVREAIEERRFAEAEEYVLRTAQVLQVYARRLQEAQAVLEEGR